MTPRGPWPRNPPSYYCLPRGVRTKTVQLQSIVEEWRIIGPSNLTRDETPDYDEGLLDVNFASGNPVSKGIPWDAYLELEVQTILKIHFEKLGFEISWRHQDDPANEKGIDLECTRDSDNQKVLIAVKKKPKKEALAQLVELVGHPANKRIYVYIGGAAQSFRDKFSTFEPQVEFWNEKKLEEHSSLLTEERSRDVVL